jgi:hypothetical protein
VQQRLVEDGEHGGGLAPHGREALALHDRQRLGAGEVDQEQVVLDQVVLEGLASGSVPAESCWTKGCQV